MVFKIRTSKRTMQCFDEIAASVKAGFDKGKTSTIIVLAEARNDLKDELMLGVVLEIEIALLV